MARPRDDAANVARVERAREILEQLYAAFLKPGVHATIGIEADVQNGVIQTVRERFERTHRAEAMK